MPVYNTASKEFATVIAKHDFDPSKLGLNRAKSRTLLILKGDKFKIFSVPNREWWGARCLATDNIGYIPSAYVEPIDSADKAILEKKQSEMDAAAIAAIAREVKISARAKQTRDDAPSQELGNILHMRQQGGGVKSKREQKEPRDDGVSSELKTLLARRNKIIEEDEQEKERVAAEPEFLKVSLKKSSNSDEVDEVENRGETGENGS